jgi:uncharacterized protein YlbG (UPF0298 family)
MIKFVNSIRVVPFMALRKKFGEQNYRTWQNKDIRKLSTNTLLNPIALNKQVLAIGNEQKWRDIIALYHKHKSEMNMVNIATTFKQLSKIEFVIKQDPAFLQFMDETMNQIQSRSVKQIGSREFAAILHSIAKFRFSNASYSVKLIAKLNSKDNVQELFETKNVQDVSNCVWACAKLGIQSPNVFRMLESRADWLFTKGDPHSVSNCVWACAKLGIQSPNLFQNL